MDDYGLHFSASREDLLPAGASLSARNAGSGLPVDVSLVNKVLDLFRALGFDPVIPNPNWDKAASVRDQMRVWFA